MQDLNILHLGIGNVGKELLLQINNNEKQLMKKYSVQLLFYGLFNSKAALLNKNGFSINKALEKIKKSSFFPVYNIQEEIQNIPLPFVVIDTTASSETYPYLLAALKRGGYVVTSNKKLLSGKQEQFDVLESFSGLKFFCETVVGAGLPVIKSIKNMIDSGDQIIEIHGCFSGTLDFIFSQLDKGKLFSEVVLEAKKKGFTEPDPRDDLSGIDVARKALILSRLLGKKKEIQEIKLAGLYPKHMKSLSNEDFLRQLYKLDDVYKEKIAKAKKKRNVLRFITKINPQECSVGLEETYSLNDFGRLNGPDNLISIKTKRYFDNPLIIKGPGAGIEVTAAGVLADILEVVRMVKGENI